MNDPELYRRAGLLKSDLKAFLDEYKSKLRWRSDGKDSLLDIGCAGGNVTIDLIHAMLPKTFSRLVGVDINETMIKYASENFKIPNVWFDLLDIGGGVSEFLEVNDRFDHITSFLCLHLVPDQKQCMNNIFELLQPDGDCLLYILDDCRVFDIYVRMYEKWFEYMQDIDDFTSPYYRCVNPEYLVSKYLENAGFSNYEIKERSETLVFTDIKTFKDAYQSVIPFFRQMPTVLHEEFMQEFVKVAEEITSSDNDLAECNGDNVKIIMPYKILTIFAKK